MSISKLVKDESLMKNLMQALGYFAFISLYMRHGIPSVKGNEVQVLPFILVFFALLTITFAFTFVHVIRPITQIWFPNYKMRGIDAGYEQIPVFSKANMVMAGLALLFTYAGWSIVGFGIN